MTGKLGSERHPTATGGRWKRQSAIAVEFDFRTIICSQHKDISLVTDEEKAGISQCILSQTNTPDGRFKIPISWPVGPNGARYDLVWVFDRAGGNGPIIGFTPFAQFLPAGGAQAPLTEDA